MNKNIFWLILVLLLASISAMAAEKPLQDYPGKIAFASNRAGNWDIYVMPADRTSLLKVTEAAGDNIMPCFNPKDPRQIAFISNREGQQDIYLVDYMLKKAERLTTTTWDERWPNFSPDGKKIIYIANPDGHFHVFEMDLATKKTKQFTDTAGDESTPCYSQDMQNITYCSNESGKWALYSAKADGTGARMFLNPEYDASHPRYSPNDTTYIFQQLVGKERKDMEIFTMDVNGKQTKQLTKDGFIDNNPTWCPSGDYIAFVSNREKGYLNICFMDKDGKNLWNFTQSSKDNPLGDNDYPSWVMIIAK